MTVAEGTGTAKWVWRPRWTWWTTKRFRPTSRRRPSGRQTAIGRLRPIRVQSPSAFALIAVTLLILLATAIEDARALGFFELQILEIENYRGQLATGECCGAPSAASAGHRPNTPPPPLQCAGAPQCNTLFQVCLREYQSRQQQPASGAAAASASSVSAAAGGGRVGGDDDAVMGSNHHQPNSQLHHCSFGNVTSPVLGGNSFMLGGDAAVQAAADSSDVGGGNRGAASGNLALPFSFSWTRSFTFILQAMDYNNYTGALSVIEEATYSGILLPGNEWKALSHLGRTARMAYRVRVRCDRNYYGQTCTKLCKPRDDRFGHYTCGDTDGRKECIPGWQGETCDKAVCKTGCHPVHGKCDYPGGCECRKGWQGELCDQCMTYPGCKHGYCNGTSWQCICDVNWGGILCDQDLNYCGTHEPCLNGGTCKSTAPDQYTCTCPEGFGGANCDVVLNPCATEPCLNGGKCRTVDAVNIGGGGLNGGGSIGGGAVALSSSVQSPPLLVPKQFHCDCRPGWTGSTCNSEIDECATQPPRCLNGGSCVDLVADWKCVCPDDRWRGRRCEIDVDECERQRERQSAVADHHQCGPNAVPCKTTGGNSAVPSTECVCRRGWTTAAAAASASRDGNNNSTSLAASVGCTVNVDDCAGPDVKCANGGTCLDLIGGYACACPAGYTGRNCRTQIDPCGGDGEPGSVNPCKNGGECVPSRRWRNGNAAGTTPAKPQQQMYSCICQWGYTGENCEVDRDHCTPNPCRNGGHCLNTPDDYYCQCSGDGWAWHGKNCTEPTDTGVAGVSRTVSTTPTTVITTTTMSTTSVTRTPSPWTSPQPPLQRITPTISTVAAIRRPGATSQGTSTWRQQQPPQYEDEEKNKAPKVAVEEQHVGDGGAGVCSGRHRRKHWLADDGCNECKCSKPSTTDVDEKTAVSCTNLWCGPSAFDCLSDATCTGTNQVCVPVANDVDDEELLDEDPDKREYADGGGTSAVNSLLLWRQCLRPPCGGNSSGFDSQARDRYVNGDRDDGDDNNGDGGGGDDDDNDDDDDDDEDDDGGYVTVKHRTRGQCVTAVTDKDDTSTTVWPLAVRHCLPNDRHPSHQKHRRRRGDACGRLRVTLDAGRLRNGTRVSAVCHSLRRLLARAWVRNEDEDLSQEADEEEDRRNRMYVMCEAAAGEDGPRDSDNGGGNRGRRKRRVTIRVSVAVVPDKQQHQRRVIPTAMADDNDDDAASVIVGRSVQTLYKRLNGALSTMVAGSKKKAPMAGHRLRTTLNNNGDDNEDFAALEFLIAAVLDVTIGDGAPVVGSPSLTVPPSSSGSSNDGDYRQYYYYWTGGVACGALATVLAVAAFLLLRFRGGSRRKIGDQQAAAEAAAAAADASAIGGGDGLMLSLVRRQNEENLKRLQVTGGNRNSVPSSMAGVDYGGAGGCGRNNLSAGSSLSCSRVSIVHPLCNAAASVDDDSSSAMQLQCKLSNGVDGGAMDGDDKAAGEKTNAPPAAAAAPAPPVAAVRSVAVAAARPQQRPAAVAAPRPILLCKKTLNVDHFQRRP